MAYAERRVSAKGPRYRGFYKGTDGRYKSAGTYDTEERALEIARAAEKRAAELVGGPDGGLDPVVGATRTIEEYAPVSRTPGHGHPRQNPKACPERSRVSRPPPGSAPPPPPRPTHLSPTPSTPLGDVAGVADRSSTRQIRPRRDPGAAQRRGG